jgi:hypothetical protein
MRRFDLELAQPSLSLDSYFSWGITVQIPTTQLRWTNFVETMVPCFKATLLVRCLPTLIRYISGWGLDWVWPRLADAEARKVAIIDRIAVTHTRPFGGPNYAFFKDKPYTAEDEADHVAREYNVDIFTTRVLAVRSRLGINHSAGGPLTKLLLQTGLLLNVLRAYARRSPQRWNVRKQLNAYLRNPAVMRGSVRPLGTKLVLPPPRNSLAPLVRFYGAAAARMGRHPMRQCASHFSHQSAPREGLHGQAQAPRKTVSRSGRRPRPPGWRWWRRGGAYPQEPHGARLSAPRADFTTNDELAGGTFS